MNYELLIYKCRVKSTYDAILSVEHYVKLTNHKQSTSSDSDN